MRLAEELGFRVQTFTHILEGYKVAPEMAAHGASASTFSDWWAYKFEVYDAIPYNTCLLTDRGVTASINSDSDDTVRRLNQEAAKSVLYCGMKPEEALLLATLNPAKQLRIEDHVGSLKVGKDADFVIWNGPPLSAYSRPEQTWIDGVEYFDIERDNQMRVAAEAERRALVQKALKMKPPKRRDDGGERRRRAWHCDDVEDTWNE
jgi:imidazolonepropionase-like amidohydrolase